MSYSRLPLLTFATVMASAGVMLTPVISHSKEAPKSSTEGKQPERKVIPRNDARAGHGTPPATAPAANREGLGARPQVALGDGPWEFQTLDYKIKVTKLADKLQRPYSMAWLPNGDMLVTERVGHLLLFKAGTFAKSEIKGLPELLVRDIVGLMEVTLHPDFKKNQLVYLGYASPSTDGGGNCAVARARYDGTDTLKDLQELFVGGPPIPPADLQNAKVRLVFDRQGYLFVSCSVPDMDRLQAQNPRSQFGKIWRLYDDGQIPADNPLVGKSEFGLTYKPEIYSLGHRSTLGMAIHPITGQVWEAENGPAGGDELNVIIPGGNYGWPIVSPGREYDGSRFLLHKDGYEDPVYEWSPSLAPSGMTFYTGDKFPKWKNSVLVGGMAGTRIDRVILNEKGEPVGTTMVESLVRDLKQRIRDVRQGPDGFIYFITEYARDGAILRIEPAPEQTPSNDVR